MLQLMSSLIICWILWTRQYSFDITVFGQDYVPTFKLFNLPKERQFSLSVMRTSFLLNRFLAQMRAQ